MTESTPQTWMVGLALVLGFAGLWMVAASGGVAKGQDVFGSGSKSDGDLELPDYGGGLPYPENDTDLAAESGTAQAVLAGGCFWCTEAVFQAVDGVSEVVSGYSGGTAESAVYRTVAGGGTDHAEAIRITYDPSKVTYGTLLRIFFATHDPTTLNRQGPDVGPQYRSAVFFEDEEERAIAAAYIAQLNAAGTFDDPIVTTLEPLEAFYEAEDYHQDFVDNNPNNPYVRRWVPDKLRKLEKLQQADAEEASAEG